MYGCWMSTLTLIRDTVPELVIAMALLTPAVRLSGMARLGVASPEPFWATTAWPVANVIAVPASVMSDSNRPESRPSHSREFGADSDDSATPDYWITSCRP